MTRHRLVPIAIAGSATLLAAVSAGAAVASNASVASATMAARTVVAASASATPALGGWTLSADGSGMRVTYEQPNLPIPATPSAEADVGYTDATFEAGPTGQAVASVLYPGQVIASAGGQLGEIVPGAPSLPDWPVQAHTTYPQRPDRASKDEGPATMQASSTAGGSTATAGYGAPSHSSGGKQVPATPALPTGLVTATEIGSTSSSTAAKDATATATAGVESLAVAGLLDIGSYTSTATASSNGTKVSLGGTSSLVGASVDGQPVTIDSKGVHADHKDVPIGLLSLTPTSLLSMAGISAHLARPVDTSSGAQGSRTTDGLQIQINLQTFDSDLAELISALPSQLQKELYMLPVPIPDDQVLTLDLGDVTAQANASKSYVPPPIPGGGSTTGTAGSSGNDGGAGTEGTTGATGVSGYTGASGVSGASGATGTSGTGGGSAGGSTSGSGGAGGKGSSGKGGGRQELASASLPATVFKGIGPWLVALGVLGAGGLTWVLLRADGAAGGGLGGAGGSGGGGGSGGAGAGDCRESDLDAGPAGGTEGATQ